jgi:hypothetical protein
MLKSMKKWTSYALWKWRGQFAKTKHNSLICVFEFKLFVCYSIDFDNHKNFVVLFLTHPMVQKNVELMKNWTSYAFESEEGDLQKLNITIQFVFLSLNFLYNVPFNFNIQFFFIILFLVYPILLKFINLIKKWKRYVHWKWSEMIQAQINDLKIQFPFLSFSSLYIFSFFSCWKKKFSFWEIQRWKNFLIW